MITWQHPELFLLGLPIILVLIVTLRRVRGLSPMRRSVALALQSMSALLLLAALAQPVWPLPDNTLDLVVVLDRSGSVSEAGAQASADYARGVLAGADLTDHVQVVAAGDAAEKLTNEQVTSGEWITNTATTQARSTDLAAGLRLAGSLLKESGRRRVVLLTDGWETQGRAAQEAAQLAGRGIDVQVVGLTALGDPEVIVEGLDMVPYARVGDSVTSELRVFSTRDTLASLHMNVDGSSVTTRTVSLKAGENQIPIDQKAQATGFHKVEVSLQGAADTSPRNNAASATLVVKPQPHVLVLEDRAAGSEPLVAALRSQQVTVDVRPSTDVSYKVSELEQYDSIVLNDVAATSFTLDQQRTLQEYVRRSGKGLVVTGGSTSYAKGGYPDSVFEDMLPVSSKPGPRPQQGETALLLVMDRSNSMDEWMGLSTSDTKFSMAKEAARLAVDALRPNDTIGLLSFDSETLWTLPLQKMHAESDKDGLKQQISDIPLGGGTYIFGAMQEAAQAMKNINAPNKHIVLLTDGQDFHDEDYASLMNDLRGQNVTVSTIGVGADADKQLLTRLAKLAQGRYYFTERLDNIPRIVFRELDLALKQATIDGKVQPHFAAPSPLLHGFAPEDIPQLGGYDLTTPKDDSVVSLSSDAGHPLLAHWNYGLGRVVAFTSEVGGKWGSQWASWDSFARFWSQTVRWSMSNPASKQLQSSISVTQGSGAAATAHISVESLDADNSFNDLADVTAALRSPAGVVTSTLLTQTAPGRYEADVAVAEGGAYEVRLSSSGDGPATEIAGFSVPLAPEERHAGTNERLLKQLNGAKLFLTKPEQALDHAGMPVVPSDTLPLWPRLLPIALLLLLASVAVRRLRMRFRPSRLGSHPAQ